MNRQIMTGDEAVARGAWEAGCTIATAYPGTPSTEILENIAAHYPDDIYAQWATNEKVAMEIAIGGSIGGARSLAAMKHVGLNVAADPLFTAAYTGVTGGLVVVCADDPGCHSSQNEQDNRHYAEAAKLILLEPSDSQECLEMTRLAFKLSEKFDMVVLLRVTTRVCHSKSLVEPGERRARPISPYEKNMPKYTMLPANARVRHARLEKTLLTVAEYACSCPLNRVEPGDGKIGVITSGISYQHAREVFGDTASYLKLGLTSPFPGALVRNFAETVETLYVVEEGDPFLEKHVRAAGVSCLGKDVVPAEGELNAAILRRAFFGEAPEETYATDTQTPPRPPVLCAGCPHRGFFYSLNKHSRELVPCGDIGCYTLGAQDPLYGIDTTICMGAGLSLPIGMAKALEQAGDRRKAFGMLGDSTFFHSGLTGLVDIVHSGANVCACILDNSITAMTGHQQNPGTAVDLMGRSVPPLDIERIVLATGLAPEALRIVDPHDLAQMEGAVKDAIAHPGPFVIITRAPCALLRDFARSVADQYCQVDEGRCTGCTACMRIGCPALGMTDEGRARVVDRENCTACGVCAQLCRFGAIERIGGDR